MKKLFSTLAVALAFAFGAMPSAHAAGAEADCAAKSAEKNWRVPLKTALRKSASRMQAALLPTAWLAKNQQPRKNWPVLPKAAT